MEQAGRNAAVTSVSNWLAAFGEKEREREIRENPEILEDGDEKYGDRLNPVSYTHLPKEWSRQEQIDYTTEYIQKTFVDKGMCADWSIHVARCPVDIGSATTEAERRKGDGNPHVHLLVTMRPFNPDHSWGNKEVKDWDFVRDTDGNIVVDESHPDWWQDKKNPDRHGIRIPVLDENGVQKVGARNRKQWKRVLTDATGWNNPKNCELWRSEWAKMCNRHLSIDNLIDL